MQLANKVAVVTGASGFRKKILQKFSEEGANIYALVRDINNDSFNDFTKKLSLKFKNKIKIIYLDLEKEETIKNHLKLLKLKIVILIY